ncbi:CAZyme family GH18 [Paecilomyces variotii]|nr:CAZyme family GH18 [Paecilomyces variotii]KAJ9332895.1 CAZyme family GH18 [Paecilomyces variotii]
MPADVGSNAGLKFQALPAEIFELVLSFLPNRDIKNLRLSSKTLNERAHLRLRRVFLSANPRNIEVFRAIADDEEFRHHIVEVIWDDVQLVDHIPERGEGMWNLDRPLPPEGVPAWFDQICWWNTEQFLGNQRRHPDLPIEESWAYYQQLLQQQQDVLASEADVEAFRYGLQRFPALRRIVITPAAHGILDHPLYETPMIRAFPPGLNYPILHAYPRLDDFDYSNLHIWPLPEKGLIPYIVPPWNQEGERLKWRAFCLLTRELAEIRDHEILELVIDPHILETGLNCRIFDGPCEEYNNLVTLLRRPGFERIDLALTCNGQYYNDQRWSSFRNGHLLYALSQALDLKHVSLQTQIDYSQVEGDGFPQSMQFAQHFVPLQTIMPIKKWQKLRHFGLSGFLVQSDDLISALSALPTTLRSIELSFLSFTGERGNWHDLFTDMRSMLDWHRAANDFFYGEGANPFADYGHRLDPFPGKGIDRDPYPFISTDMVGPTYCSDGRQSNCNATAECGQYASERRWKDLPLKCSQYGFCGTTSEFCGTGCQSDCTQPSPDVPASSVQNRVVGYWEAWNSNSPCGTMSPGQIPATILTHLNVAFGSISADFDLTTMPDVSAAIYQNVGNLKSKNPDLNSIISVCGWDLTDAGPTQEIFTSMVSSIENRATFIQNGIAWLGQYGYDGIDFDWEYPGAGDRGSRQEDGVNYALLLQELCTAIDACGKDYIVTFTAPTSYWYLQNFDLTGMVPYVDWVNMMSYDLHVVWDATDVYIDSEVFAHTNLTEISLFWRANVPPSDIVLRLGFYGRTYELTDASCWKPGFDDATTFAAKIEYANKIGLGGLMVWVIDLDDTNLNALGAITDNSAFNISSADFSLAPLTT